MVLYLLLRFAHSVPPDAACWCMPSTGPTSGMLCCIIPFLSLAAFRLLRCLLGLMPALHEPALQVNIYQHCPRRGSNCLYGKGCVRVHPLSQKRQRHADEGAAGAAVVPLASGKGSCGGALLI